MSDEIEKFKIMVDLAKDNGAKDAMYKQQKTEVAKLREKSKSLQQELEEERSLRMKAEREIQKLEKRIKEYELKLAQNTGTSSQNNPTYVIQNFIVLSMSKTVTYVSQLDDDQRIFTNHLLINTLADTSSVSTYDSIKRLTQLGAYSSRRTSTRPSSRQPTRRRL